MTTGYLELLDALLASGTSSFSPAFRERQIAFVLARQQADGGFAGRQGAADLYYTDFALRTLALAAYQGPAWGQAARYLARQPIPSADTPALFNLLHGARLLARAGYPLALPPTALRDSLHRGTLDSAYALFLGQLCAEMLDDVFQPAAEVAAMLERLRCPAGGYRNVPGESGAQTNATAAAMALLTMLALREAYLREDAGALARWQRADGGWPAHPAAPASDLLSTFTALLTLLGLGELAGVDLAAGARFLQRLAEPHGGFRACAGDDAPDVEYTYYGVATLALLRAQVSALVLEAV